MYIINNKNVLLTATLRFQNGLKNTATKAGKHTSSLRNKMLPTHSLLPPMVPPPPKITMILVFTVPCAMHFFTLLLHTTVIPRHTVFTLRNKKLFSCFQRKTWHRWALLKHGFGQWVKTTSRRRCTWGSGRAVAETLQVPPHCKTHAGRAQTHLEGSLNGPRWRRQNTVIPLSSFSDCPPLLIVVKARIQQTLTFICKEMD